MEDVLAGAIERCRFWMSEEVMAETRIWYWDKKDGYDQAKLELVSYRYPV